MENQNNPHNSNDQFEMSAPSESVEGGLNSESKNLADIPGGIFRRFAATLIDVVILYLFQMPFSKILVSVLGIDQSVFEKISQGDIPQEFIIFQTYSFIIGIGVSYFYYVFCYQWKRASLGKLALDMEVIVLKSGNPPSFMTVFLRETLGKPVGAILIMIGYIMAMFRSDKRGLHDLIAGTQVIRRRR
jgi:uncharacterized RDD family membrane protein YckC